jgi:hypothetical protein
MKIYDNEQGKEIEISDADIPAVAGNPRFSLPNKEFEFEDEYGIRGKVNAKNIHKAIVDGLKYIPESQVEYEDRLAEAANKPIEASAVALARGVTLGGSDYLLRKSGKYTPEELKALEEGNPALSTTFDIVGSIAPGLVSGGTGTAARVARFAPSAIAELAGRQAAKVGGKILSNTTSNVAKKALEISAGSAVEGALFGAGRVLTEDAMGDAEFNAESVLSAMGKNALVGGAFGFGSTLAYKGAEKAIGSSVEKVSQAINKFAESGDIGILKKLGAQKGHFKKLLNSNSLDEKDMVEYALDLTKGFDDTAETILANQGVTKKGGKTLVGAATSSLEDISKNNETVKDGAVKLMNSALKELDDEFNVALANPSLSKMNPKDFVFGRDLSARIQKELLEPLKDIYSPRKAEIQKLADDLSELGAVKDDLGNVISYKPLSPQQLRDQSIEFGNIAKWESVVPSGKQEVFKEMRKHLENILEDNMSKLKDGKSLVDKYKKGKKLYQKAATLDDMLVNGIARENANNRGFSLTESILTGAGASIAGLPGAIAAYALRKGQREYGDVATSYLLRKIEKASNKSKVQISDAVDSFFKNTQRVSNKYLTGMDLSENDLKDTEDKISLYSQSPDRVVENFMKNNEDLLNIAPSTSQVLQQRILDGVQFLNTKLPRKEPSPFNDTNYSRSELLKFKNYVEAVEKPQKTIENIKSGYITPESIEAFEMVYPKLLQSIKNEVSSRLPEFKNLTEYQKTQISRLLNLESRKAFTPRGFQTLQGVSAQGVQRDLANNQPNRSKVPVSAAKNLGQSGRIQSGLDKVLNRS